MLNLIKLIIDRAIERIFSIVSPEDVKEIAVHRLVCTTTADELADALIVHERVERQFNNLTSKAVAKHIDLSDLAEYIDTSDLAENVAYGLDLTAVAGNIDLSDLAGEIDLSDLTDSIDYERLAKAMDPDHLAMVAGARVSAPETDGLEERINEAVSQAVASALDAANRKTEPVVEQSPDLVARLLDLAVEKLLARADEAAKNGEV